MNDSEKRLEDLYRQMADLKTRQVQMKYDIVQLEKQMDALKGDAIHKPEEMVAETIPQPDPIIVQEEQKPYIQQAKERVQQKVILQQERKPFLNKEMEDFIGTNIISKVGILITIIGVFIGAKYAIDKDLISPAMRIVFGYMIGSVLMGLAFRLKAKYLSFSAILMGGGLAVMYFITYIGYSFYALFPQLVAFGFMLITTVAAVAIALWYNQRIIALLGQVAAYAIPFLLSNNSGNVLALFTYISIINVGLVFLSLKKDWKLLYRIAFFITWIIYLAWLLDEVDLKAKFATGLIFMAINFFTFYATFLSFKMVKKEMFDIVEMAILLANALMFFFLGYHLINASYANPHNLTYFSLANAIIHFAVGYAIYKRQIADKTVSQFIISLGILFFTITIPIELDGSWVTLLWAFEAMALVIIGTNNQRRLYLHLAIPLFIISFFSLLQDWDSVYPFLNNDAITPANVFRPFVNIHFLLSIIVCSSIGLVAYKVRNQVEIGRESTVVFFYRTVVPVAFLLLLYFTFFLEIHYVYDVVISNVKQVRNVSLLQAESLFIYTFIYLSFWLVVNKKWLQIERLQYGLMIVSSLVNIIFLVHGLYLIGELRYNYLHGHFGFGEMLFNRYTFIAALGLLWTSCYASFTLFAQDKNIQRLVSVLFNMTLLTLIANEFIHWMDIAGYKDQYKLGLSLIGGAYALALIFIGIIKRRKHLRVSAIVLFVITLVKLFFYDLSSLSTISKTIVFVLLGVLLLITSFLYNKYKELLFNKDES